MRLREKTAAGVRIFGNALGSAITDQMGQPEQTEKPKKAPTLGEKLFSNSVDAWGAQQTAGFMAKWDSTFTGFAEESQWASLFGGTSTASDAARETAVDTGSGSGASVPETVRAGDFGGSLERIARAQLGPDASQREINNYVGQLAELNGIHDPRKIRGDRDLRLPDASTPAATEGLGVYARDIALGESLKQINLLSSPVLSQAGQAEVLRSALASAPEGTRQVLLQQASEKLTQTQAEFFPSRSEAPLGPSPYFVNSAGGDSQLPAWIGYTDGIRDSLHVEVPTGVWDSGREAMQYGLYGDGPLGDRLLHVGIGAVKFLPGLYQKVTDTIWNIPSNFVGAPHTLHTGFSDIGKSIWDPNIKGMDAVNLASNGILEAGKGTLDLAVVGALARGPLARTFPVLNSEINLQSAFAPNTATKLSFDPSLNPVDKAFATRAATRLAEDRVGSAFYRRLQQQGTDVFFVNDPAMKAMGEFNPGKNSVTVNMLRHTSAEEAASTVVHESTHQYDFFKGAPLNTQYSEYLAFRNESLFQNGVRPSLFERQQIWQDVQKLYPNLPQGKYPFGGGQ